MWRNVFALALAASGVYAQEVAHTGTLTGLVTDSLAAVISGVKVTVVNQDTQVTSQGLTNETGRYFIPYLNPGKYEVRAVAAGFKAYIRTGVELQAGESPRIDIQLEVGAVTESIIVSGATPLLETETSTVSGALSHEQFMDRLFLLQNRSFNVLMYLPGVSNISEATFSMLGQRARSIANEVDGVSAKMPVQDTPVGDYQALLVPADALEEARVLTTVVPAEFGNAGSGMIVQVMKSGTNQLHGSAEDRYLNTDLEHRAYFTQTQQPLSYHDLSATMGGPVYLPKIYNGKDKTFFFFGWQRQNERDGFTDLDNVPTPAMLNGDFSLGGVGYPIYDPKSFTQNAAGTWTATQFPNNQIPVSRFDPVAVNFLSRNPWRLPNVTGVNTATGPQQNWVGVSRYRSYRSRFSWKVDQQLTPTHKFFVRVNWNHHRRYNNEGDAMFEWLLLNPGAFPQRRDMIGPSISDTWTITPTLINEVRVSMTRFRFTLTPTTTNQGWAQTLGIPNVSATTFPEFPDMLYPVNLGNYQETVEANYTFAENVTKVMGPHTFKMGYQLIKSSSTNIAQDAPSGMYNFSGSTSYPFTPNTGNAFAGFLLGAVSSAQFTQNQAAWLPRWWQHALYFQDDYKPTRTITLNMGLRWSYESPFKTKYGQQSEFNPNVVDPLTGLMGAITHPTGPLSKDQWHNFQPRFGLAWNLRKNLVFRGGFGLTTMDLLANDLNVAFDEYVAIANVQSPPGNPTPAFYLSQGPPAHPFTVLPNGTSPYVGTNYSQRTATYYDPNMYMPRIMNWSAGFQYQFRPTWLVEARYEGTAGVGLLNWWNMNQIPLNISTNPTVLTKIYQAPQNYLPYPQFGQIADYSNFGHSTYHSATIRIEKRFSNGIGLNTFYTYSKALDNDDNESQSTGADFYNRSLEKAQSGFNLTHRFINTVMYDLPFGKGRHFMNRGGVLNAIFGGWELNWNDTLQSGLPFSVTYAGSPNMYLPGGGVSRPNILVPYSQAIVNPWNIGPNRFPTSAQNPYLNASAFAYPASFTVGDLGRNTFRAPLVYWPQGSVVKNWRIKERMTFTFRFAVQNVFNRPQFSTPGSVYNLSNLGEFGRFTSNISGFSGIGGPFNSSIIVRLQF